MKLGLERMEEVLKRLKPKLPPVVQIVGTNGKGSTAVFFSGLAQAHGLQSALFTSPHFLDVRERFLINGWMLPKSMWLDAANRLAETSQDIDLSYFEFLTALSLIFCQDHHPDVAVFEAGLGGRYDSTTALPRSVVLFTAIGLDHEGILGPDLATIAEDKAGALAKGTPAVSSVQDPQVWAVLQASAVKYDAPLIHSDDVFRFVNNDVIMGAGREVFLHDVPLGLIGAHQRNNAGLALAGWAFLAGEMGWPIRGEACRQGLNQAFIPGRLQSIPGAPLILLDGAHNAHGLGTLSQALKQLKLGPVTVIFACLKDKNLGDMADALKAIETARIIVPGIPGLDRAYAPEQLADELTGRTARMVEWVSSTAEALEMAKSRPQPILICGSLYLLAEYYRLFPECLGILEGKQDWSHPEGGLPPQ